MHTFSLLTFLVAVLAHSHDHGDHSHSAHSHDHGHDHGHGTFEHVMVLTDKNFEEEVRKTDLIMVEFYAPWCGHCKRLAPEYEDAAGQLWGKVSLAKMDCTVNDDTCSKHNVRGFPTIKVFRNGNLDVDTPYEGGRTAVSIVSYLEKQLRPAVTELATEEAETEALAALSHNEDLSVVSYAPTGSDEDVFFRSFGKANRDKFNFFVSGSGSASGVVLYRNFDARTLNYEGELTEEAFGSWLNANSLPLCGPIGPENYGTYAELGRPLVWLFVDYEAEGANQLLESCVQAAKASQGEFSFVHLDGVKWAEHAQNFGLDPSTLPVSCIEKREPRQIFVFDGEYTQVGLEAWIENVKSGQVQPTLKSEPIPETNDGPVTVLVGKNFEEVAYDETKDVLVAFFAPWCGHCKSLAPKFEELGSKFAEDSSTVIAKLDATANDTPEQVEGFPTLVFYPAVQGRTGEKYDGAREVEDLYTWIQSRKMAGAQEAEPVEPAQEVHDEL